MDLDLDLIRSVVTVLSLAVFVGICVWASRHARDQHFDAAARLPFEGE